MTKIQRWALLFLGLLVNVSVAAENLKPLPGQTAVRVCADAHNLPYSNDKLEGFDNKIAALLGEELGIPVEYYWFPQRIGFSRNTIKKENPETGKYMCDLAMSVPTESDFLATTKPYFQSIEAMVYRSDDGLNMKTLADIAETSKTKKLTIGIFDRGTTTKTLLDLGLGEQIRYYQMMPGDARINAGRIVSDALASGEVDVALLWGPIASYYASISDVPMTVVPLNELTTDFVFSFGFGTRYPDRAWRKLLNEFVDKRKADIDAIMAEYNLPSLANVAAAPEKKKRELYKVAEGKVDDKTYIGWRLFNSTCFVCHGRHATGTDRAPNLLLSVENMSERAFRKKVLSRYFAKVNLDDPDRRSAFLAQLTEAESKEFKMPTWLDDPNIRPHISELYAYLKARSDGALGEERPQLFDDSQLKVK